ncbi:hypothetical protein BJ138DRAFT_1105288 [Hygrophoropsis aurantiaca]|uniref:Uncharacterized protein n=1 Tax=Hygrophoropsis aurantiaca TaxID=72124 RepID=A0ACB7ZZR5_9AGAM|nr:hypothetical protein BJ138DRAFT_1105288 [Hygrophoropsis aurantiaca]
MPLSWFSAFVTLALSSLVAAYCGIVPTNYHKGHYTLYLYDDYNCAGKELKHISKPINGECITFPFQQKTKKASSYARIGTITSGHSFSALGIIIKSRCSRIQIAKMNMTWLTRPSLAGVVCSSNKVDGAGCVVSDMSDVWISDNSEEWWGAANMTGSSSYLVTTV